MSRSFRSARSPVGSPNGLSFLHFHFKSESASQGEITIDPGLFLCVHESQQTTYGCVSSMTNVWVRGAWRAEAQSKEKSITHRNSTLTTTKPCEIIAHICPEFYSPISIKRPHNCQIIPLSCCPVLDYSQTCRIFPTPSAELKCHVFRMKEINLLIYGQSLRACAFSLLLNNFSQKFLRHSFRDVSWNKDTHSRWITHWHDRSDLSNHSPF